MKGNWAWRKYIKFVIRQNSSLLILQMKIDFQTATEKNVPEILLMMEQFYAIDHYPFNKDRARENLLKLIANPGIGRIWVILCNHLLVGYAALTFGFSFEYGGQNAFIDELFLKSEYRQKGIGRQAIDFIAEEALKLGIQTIHLEAERHNINAIKLYKLKGFSDNGRTLMFKKLQ